MALVIRDCIIRAYIHCRRAQYTFIFKSCNRRHGGSSGSYIHSSMKKSCQFSTLPALAVKRITEPSFLDQEAVIRTVDAHSSSSRKMRRIRSPRRFLRMAASTALPPYAGSALLQADGREGEECVWVTRPLTGADSTRNEACLAI